MNNAYEFDYGAAGYIAIIKPSTMERKKKSLGRKKAKQSLQGKRCSFFGKDDALSNRFARKLQQWQAGNKKVKGCKLDLILKAIQLLVQLMHLIKAIESLI